MNVNFTFPYQNLGEWVPCYLECSLWGRLERVGPFFTSAYGKSVMGQHITDIVDFEDPAQWTALIGGRLPHSRVGGRLRGRNLRIQGPLVASEQGYLYLARPIINTLDEAVEAGLDISSFGPHDPTLKLLLSTHMQANLLAQYRELAEKLNEARRALLEPIAAMWEMSAFIAHDFKNYLNAIAMSVDRIAMSEVSGIDSSIDIMRQAVAQASSLADAISDIARNHKYERTRFEFHRILQANRRVFEALLGVDVDLEIELAEGDLHLIGNIPVFIGCLMTIVSNAKQALGDHGTVKIFTSRYTRVTGDAECGLPPGEYARVSIEDDGPGIPFHLLPNVAKPFVSTKGSGRGLGLASVAEYCRRHEGTLSVNSRAGAGTTVELILPIAAANS